MQPQNLGAIGTAEEATGHGVNLGGPVLSVRGLSKSYGQTAALQDLSIEAFPGEIIGLLGPNGAGKTTAIRVLTTILSPSSGEFTIAGVPASRPRDIRRRIGVLPESSAYPLNLSGGEFLRYHARLFGYRPVEASRVAASLLADVGLSERASSPIATYSRGMRQRLGVARALVNQPCVVFLDEPTLGLDPAGQRQILRMIRDVAQQRGASVILSTHFLEEVEETCSRVVILNRGRVIAQGTVAEVTRKAGVRRTGRFRIPPELQDQALAALRGTRGVAEAESAGGQLGNLTVTLGETDDRQEASMNQAIAGLLAAGIPVLSFEVEGSRLSDAFFSMTEDAEG